MGFSTPQLLGFGCITRVLRCCPCSSWGRRGQGCLNLAALSFPQGILWKKVKVLVAQSYPTPCHPMDCSTPGSSIPGILQARILECIAIPFSRGSSWPRDQTWVSCIAGRCFTFESLFPLWVVMSEALPYRTPNPPPCAAFPPQEDTLSS